MVKNGQAILFDVKPNSGGLYLVVARFGRDVKIFCFGVTLLISGEVLEVARVFKGFTAIE